MWQNPSFEGSLTFILIYFFIEVALVYKVYRFYVYNIIFLLLYTLQCAHHQKFCFHLPPYLWSPLPITPSPPPQTKPNANKHIDTENRVEAHLPFRVIYNPHSGCDLHLAEMWLSMLLSCSPVTVSWTFLPCLLTTCRRITNSHGIYNQHTHTQTHVHKQSYQQYKLWPPNK